MLASRSYDGMTVSLKLWGEEERKGMQVSTDGWDERCVRAVAAGGDPPAGGRKRQPWRHCWWNGAHFASGFRLTKCEILTKRYYQPFFSAHGTAVNWDLGLRKLMRR